MKRFICVFILTVVFFTAKSTSFGTEKFDPDFYAGQNPDVVEVFGTNPEALYVHYITYGKTEGRLPYEEAVDIPVERLGDTDDDVNDEIIRQLSYVPDKLKTCFIKAGYTLYHTSEDVAQTEFSGKYKSVRGVTNYTGKYIKIHDRMVAARTAVCHEFGHILYSMAGRFDGNGLEEVISAFGQEKENYGQALSGTNGLDNHMEFYAEVFFLYCHDRVKACDLYPVVSGLIESDLAALD